MGTGLVFFAVNQVVVMGLDFVSSLHTRVHQLDKNATLPLDRISRNHPG